MKHTADPDSYLGMVCEQVARLKPMERITFSAHTMHLYISQLHHNDHTWNPAQRVLSNIIGSRYTHSWYTDERGNYVFCRHEKTGQVWYEEPDDHVRRMGI